MPWENVKSVFRPETVHMGIMTVDAEKCTRPNGSKCQLCFENCPFRAWEIAGEQQPPVQKGNADCFSCSNCMVACPRDAISFSDTYHVDDGFYATSPHPLPAKPPLDPLDADGNPDEWTAIERAVLNRRSVRNYKDDPVPETIIRRVLEAGRFAPSAGNCQPWKFIVVTNKSLISEMDDAIVGALSMMYNVYTNDDAVKSLADSYEANPNPGLYDPRIMLGGVGSVIKRYLPVFLNAPAVILIAGDERAISGTDINVGVCGQNMVLVANSLGIRACWVGFSQVVNMVPPIREKLGLEAPWKISSSVVLGYPKFKQDGMVAREFRPVTWFREGAETYDIEE